MQNFLKYEFLSKYDVFYFKILILFYEIGINSFFNVMENGKTVFETSNNFYCQLFSILTDMWKYIKILAQHISQIIMHTALHMTYPAMSSISSRIPQSVLSESLRNCKNRNLASSQINIDLKKNSKSFDKIGGTFYAAPKKRQEWQGAITVTGTL